MRLVNTDYGRHPDIHEHLLQFLRGDSRLKRALTILKARGSAHDPSTRQYEITTNGVILGDHFDRSDASIQFSSRDAGLGRLTLDSRSAC